ncbi:MAG: class I SAM-dependent methyltransferase [Acidobacteria bacterium]|nr:class I SAM-dependent methyltransferase [Acidobacteriota bacterium]
MFKESIKKALSKFGIGVYRLNGKYAEDGFITAHTDSFRGDPCFRQAYERGIRSSDGVDPHFEWRVHAALWAAQTSLRVPGDFVECGVNAGFISSAVMQYLDWNRVGRRFFLIDTFSGPVLDQYSEHEVQASRRDIAVAAMNAGSYVTDLERVRANFAEWPSATVIQGAIPDVLQTAPIEQVAFLHIDMNCALPEQAALEFFWDRLPSGGAVLLDDYAYLGHDCQRRAIDHVARRFHRTVLVLPTGQGLIIR